MHVVNWRWKNARVPVRRAGEPLGGERLQLGALVLELLDRRRGGAPRRPLRDQEVAREAVLHLHHVAQLAQVGDLLHQDDFH